MQPFIGAIINYHDRKELGDRGYAILDLKDFKNTTFFLEPHKVRVHDARRASPQLSLEENGIVLVRRPTAVRDFYDDAEVRRVYYPETERLLKEVVGADEVLVFGEVLRSDDPANLTRGQEPGARNPRRSPPAGGAHVDFNEEGVRSYIVDLAGAREAERLLKKRFMNINVWRPIKRVERMPLAVADAATVEAADFIPCQTRGPVGPDVGPKDGYNVAYSPKHRWWYFPLMEPDEALVFKIYDSKPVKARHTPHSAFVDPSSDAVAAPRESFEIRSICFLPE
jgi:hypothetical protein